MASAEGAISRKVVVVGNSGVGKTALVLRYVQNTFNQEYPATIGGSYLAKKINVDDTSFNLQIWDTAGQERFRSMVRIYYRGASAAILVFDVTDKSSFLKLKEWVNELHSVLGEDVVLTIACNKIDLAARRQVTADQVNEYAQSIKATVHETSAKTKEGVEELFMDIGERLRSTLPEEGGSGGGGGGGGAAIVVDNKDGGKKGGCC